MLAQFLTFFRHRFSHQFLDAFFSDFWIHLGSLWSNFRFFSEKTTKLVPKIGPQTVGAHFPGLVLELTLVQRPTRSAPDAIFDEFGIDLAPLLRQFWHPIWPNFVSPLIFASIVGCLFLRLSGNLVAYLVNLFEHRFWHSFKDTFLVDFWIYLGTLLGAFWHTFWILFGSHLHPFVFLSPTFGSIWAPFKVLLHSFFLLRFL